MRKKFRLIPVLLAVLAVLAAVLLILRRGALRDTVDCYADETYSAKPVIYLYPDADAAENADEVCDAKPVLYLSPEEALDVTVTLDYDGRLTCTYPAYNDGWRVHAAPDGTLTDENGQTYRYLYWEGVTDTAYDFSRGFCIRGSDTAAFLENALAQLGLTREEANEFIIYWLPQMQESAYNLIAFQGEAYTNSARLTITPTPDTLIRVFMAWTPLDAPVELAPQALTAPARSGFTAVEWGGAKVAHVPSE